MRSGRYIPKNCKYNYGYPETDSGNKLISIGYGELLVKPSQLPDDGGYENGQNSQRYKRDGNLINS
jgi:hypothetical protein